MRESELRLRLALDAAQMGTFEADIAGTEAVIDAQEARLLGLPEDTRIVSVEELRARIPVDELYASDTKQERMTVHHEPYQHEFRLRMPDGSERWLSGYADVRSNRIFGVNFDITERKRAEAALRESEARLRIATNGAALGIFERDIKADRTVWVNDRMFEIFGRTHTDGSLTRQQFVDDYLHPSDVNAFEDALRQPMQMGGPFHVTCRIRRKDGLVRWLQIDGKIELADTGEPLRAFGVVADITERRTLERKAQRLAERVATIQDEERRTIAQELHDSTVQHLVAASLGMMSLRHKRSLQPEDEMRWNEVDASLQKAMNELRTASYLMHPPALRTRHLRSSLRQYIDGFANRSGLSIEIRTNPKIDQIPLRLRRTLFRIIQEALGNVYRHASASHVSVQIRWIADRLHIIITDNGRAVERRGPRAGVRLRGIRERVKEYAGELKLVGVKPNGARLHAAIPASAVARKSSTGRAH